jgi:putative ABC transport system permease protein
MPRYASEAAQDLRIAWRRIRRTPMLTGAVVLTIGLGLGSGAAIVTAFDAALIRPLPFAAADRLIQVWEVRRDTGERTSTSYATLDDWRARAGSLIGLEGHNGSNLTVSVGDEVRMLRGAQVTPGFFRLLGVHMTAGRDFLPERDANDGSGVVIVSHRFASAGGGEGGLGRTITVNGAPLLVVGILPPTFQFASLQDADIWTPLTADGAARGNRSLRVITVVARLRDGARLSDAQTELAAVMSELASAHPDVLGGRGALAVSLRDSLLGNVKPILIALVIAVGLLLATLTTNLALLMLTRYVERAPELAMRSALGATKARILRQLLVESAVLAVAGGGLAVLVAQDATRALIAAIPENLRIGMPYLMDLAPGTGTLLFIAGAAALLAVGLGLAPALAMPLRWQPDTTRVTAGRRDRLVRRGLVVSQLAMTVVLLVASGLLVSSFRNLAHHAVGFADPESLLTAQVSLSGNRYRPDEAQQRFYETLVERAGLLPGVRRAAMISELPLGGAGMTTLDVVDQPRPLSAQPRVAVRMVAGNYFETMGTPLIAGRTFESRDRAGNPDVAVINASFARTLAANGTALGRRLRLARTGDRAWEVIGVVGDVQAANLDLESPPVVYVSHLQLAENRMSVVLRSAAGVTLANDIRGLVKQLDTSVPVYGLATIQQQIDQSRAIFHRRFPMMLCGGFAAAALLLSLVALFAMCAHDVQTRRREFGVRLALGASPGDVQRIVWETSVVTAVSGVALGAMLALPASTSLAALLFGVTATDWRVYGAVAVGVVGAALLATLMPALRAAAIDPSTVIRQE